jgi:NAD(P)-dependent dehydrogenase (short-subunit alcohol dehydrogenase family)
LGGNPFALVGIIIILSGASGGIGQAILPALAKLDEVIAVYHSRRPAVNGLGSITLQQLDLTAESDVKAFVEAIKDRLARVTLVHAAVLSRDGLAARLDLPDWEQTLRVNLGGPFLLTRALLTPMIAQKWGRIIHISSVAGLRGVPGTLAYSTTKTGLLGMSRVLAQEYARVGITSNVLVAGYFNTGLIETLSAKAREEILRAIPAKKLGDPQNIANAIEFLIKSEYVNGAAIHIDGGL